MTSETLRRSFVRMLRAENKAPRTIETYTLAVDQLAAHLARRSDAPAHTADLGRADLHEYFIALEEQASSLPPATSATAHCTASSRSSSLTGAKGGAEPRWPRPALRR